MSNEEKSLFNAFRKFESQIKNAPNDSAIMVIFRQAFADPKSNTKTSLRHNEAIEILKYLDKAYLIDELERIQVPKFELTGVDILSLEIASENLENNTMKLSDYLIENKLKFNINKIVYDLRMLWINSNFTLSMQDLLKKCDKKFVEKYFIEKKLKSKK